MTPGFAEVRVATGKCANCFIEKGEAVWAGREPNYRWLCVNCGFSYGTRAKYLKPGEIPPGAMG